MKRQDDFMKDNLKKNYQPNIMIVDDTPENLNLLSAVLKDCGYRVRPAPGGKIALQAIQYDPPDLILLDVMMPEMDGFEVCRILKNDEKTRGIPVIFLTASQDKLNEEKGLIIGAVDYITKPFQEPVIKARVETHLQLKFHRERLEQMVAERTAELSAANQALQEEILDHKRAEDTLKISLKEKEALLQELHHRTFNNMQVISGMLNMQASYVDDEKIKNVFRDMVNRIYAMAKVHQKLYQSQNLSDINLKDYISDLTPLIKSSYNESNKNIDYNLVLEDVIVMIDIAIPLGLVLNELITNAFKYAFPNNRKGLIAISLCRINNDKLEFQVSDNGIGVPKNFDFKAECRMGLKLVYDIVEHQLEGSIDFETVKGVKAIVWFKDKLYDARV